MLGKIEFDNFKGLTEMPQEAASAWTAVDGLCGASFKPLVYIGKQVARGTNYFFIAEETTVTNPPNRHIVTIAINSFNGIYTIVPSSIEVIIA